jgi:hypothetical protein
VQLHQYAQVFDELLAHAMVSQLVSQARHAFFRALQWTAPTPL